LLKSLMPIMHNTFIWTHNGHLEQVVMLYESIVAHLLAINTFKVGNTIHFNMLANHYYS